MIKSMTAFGRARSTVGGKDITVELRSVNSRYFDCTVRLPRTHTYLEEKIKACADDDSDEAFDLGLAEFNLSNYMIMLDDRISMLRGQIEEEK